MKEKQEETCENCGHSKQVHTFTAYYKGYCSKCTCKKFVAKKGLDKKSKGCGKEVDCYGYDSKTKGWKCGQQYLDEEIILCPLCKAKNHSPQGNSNFKGKNSIVKPEGTFNLSKKKFWCPRCCRVDGVIYAENVKEFIKQENELLELLEKGDLSFNQFNFLRNKLAGDLK